MELLRSQRNAVLLLIENLGFDPTDFSWGSHSAPVYARSRVVDQNEVPFLMHVPTEHFALFDISDSPWTLRISPGRESTAEEVECRTWDAMRSGVYSWLTYLKREIEQPDLWQLVGVRRKLVEDATAADARNDRFDQAEQEAIASRLDEIKNHLFANYQLQEEQRQLVEEQFEFLKAESKTQGRRSWVQLALGSVLGMYLAKIDPAAVQYTLRQIVDTFMPYITKLLAVGS